jgi:hypothetical protein
MLDDGENQWHHVSLPSLLLYVNNELVIHKAGQSSEAYILS